MTATMKCKFLTIMSLLLPGMTVAAQAPRPKEALSLQGCAGKVNIVQIQGRALVDVEDLARITNGSITFEGDRIILNLRCDGSKPATDETAKLGFSRPFMKAAIEAMASIREWGGMLYITVQNGYPVGNTMAGNTIEAYHGRAEDAVGIAASAAFNESDSRGLELLRNEFNNVRSWSDRYIKARSTLSAAEYTIRENALQNDPEVQSMVQCGQFLAQMFAGGTFQDQTACR